MKTWSLKWRAAVGAMLMCFLLISLIGFSLMHFMRKDLSTLIADQQRTLVTSVAQSIDGKLSFNLDAISAYAAAFPAHLLAFSAQVRAHHGAHPVFLSLFDDILVFAPNGDIIADFPELSARKSLNASDRSFFQQVLITKRAVISEPVISKTRREPILQMAAPIMNSSGQLAGIMVGVIRLYKPNFLGNLGEAKIGKSGYFSLLSKTPKEVYIAHPDKGRILQTHTPESDPAVRRALEGFKASGETVSHTGSEALITSTTLRNAPWVLIAVAPTQEVFSPIAEAEQQLMMILLCVTLLVLSLVWLAAWHLLGPLEKLRDAIIHLHGSPTEFVPVPVNRTDELGDLTKAFNTLMQERIAAQVTQQETESTLRLIADNMPALISFLDRNLRYTFANQKHTEWFGKTSEEMIRRTPGEVFGADQFESIRPYFEAALRGERVSYDHQRKTLGASRFTHTTLIPHLSKNGRVIGIFKLTTDISERKQTELALNDLVRMDPLTGLCNRHGFDERLPAALQRNARSGAWMALMFLDVDNFKHINDSLGHATGDEVLREFGRRLSACVRVTDTVARPGGDEFTIILEGLNKPHEAIEVAEKIQPQLQVKMTTSGGDCQVTSSIGIALCRKGSTDAVELLRQADEAVYEAKRNGRNRYHVASLPKSELKLVAAAM